MNSIEMVLGKILNKKGSENMNKDGNLLKKDEDFL
jgi:hypothetical protein